MTFLEKYGLLKKSIPVPAVWLSDCEQCEYVDYSGRLKNCQYCFYSAKLNDCVYTIIGFWGNKLVDCTSISESEKCYQCIDCSKCYNSTYLIDCNNSTDCHYSSFLNSCSNCFGCVGLTHKKYCIFNRQYTKEEYFKKVEELKKEKTERILMQMHKLKSKIPHPAGLQFNTQNCPYGDYIYNSKDCYWVFNSYYCQNSGYNYFSLNTNNCWDASFIGSSDNKFVAERCYELIDSGRGCYNCAYLIFSEFCTNCYYCDNLINCTDCVGCVGLKNKKYCILNNQLTKDQYEKAVKEIKRELEWKF